MHPLKALFYVHSCFLSLCACIFSAVYPSNPVRKSIDSDGMVLENLLQQDLRRILKMCLHLIECEDMWLCCCLYIAVRDSMLDDDWIPSSHHANVAWFEMNIFLAHLCFECCDLRWLFRFNICYYFLFTSVRTFTCANICYIHHLYWEIELEKEL